ncbi:MAG: DegV family protein [Rhizobacter sp.]|nr:DegV family protein [Chlorobiales bacterium]
MAMKVAIVTDSTCDLPEDILSQYGIHEIALRVVINGQSRFDDGVDLNHETFYDDFVTNKSTQDVSTAPPTTTDFLNLYKQLCLNYDAVLSIHIADKFSDTVKNARAAAMKGAEYFKAARLQKDLSTPFQVRVIDSRSVTIGLGLLVMRAAELLGEGVSFAALGNALEVLANDVHVYLVVDDLSYVRARRRGANISLLQLGMASLLDIKPILFINKGETKTIDKKRGYDTATAEVMRIVIDLLQKKECYEKVGITYSGNKSTLSEMKGLDTFRTDLAAMGVGSIFAIMGPTLGYYSGPKCLAIAFINGDVKASKLLKQG